MARPRGLYMGRFASTRWAGWSRLVGISPEVTTLGPWVRCGGWPANTATPIPGFAQALSVAPALTGVETGLC